MPIQLMPASRRTFLRQALVGAAALACPSRFASAEESSGGWLAWLSDIHIAGDEATIAREQNMAANLRQAIKEILSEPDRPRGVFIDGDLALKDGQGEDYRTIVTLLGPLREARLPIHLTLGNHDDRARFREVLHAEPPPETRIQDRHVSTVTALGHRIILLDSLQRPNYTPGLLGPEQLAWLAQTLDRDGGTPTILFVHHNLSTRQGALSDTEELLEVITPRRQVKAVVYGHSHRWEHEDHDGLHLINLPAIAYPFGPDQPLGWARFEPTPQGASLTLHAIGGDRSKNGERLELAWRKS